MTMVSGVQGANYGYVNRVSKREQKLDEKVFAEAQKQVKKAEVRNVWLVTLLMLTLKNAT